MQPAPRRLGPYEVVRVLARGGMAELFLAHLPGIDGFARKVAIKRVLPELATDPDFIKMFLEEARVSAMLHHQNIVAVHDVDQDEGGYFLVMEYLHGADLGELLRATDGDLPLPIALEIARGACAGLHYAHERQGPGGPLGIIHRDVSPQNIFVTFDGGVKLLDFGIAKALQQSPSHYTRSGTLRGKLPYMSPEQCRGLAIDRRSDVFSLAVVIWEMTVGERLFGAQRESEFEILKSIVEVDAPRPGSRKRSYPPALEAILMKGLARERERRHATCDELQGELEGFIRAGSLWTTARDLARYMTGRFAERAASSMKLAAAEAAAAGGEIVPFPRVTRVVPARGEGTTEGTTEGTSEGTSEGTIDLPKQRHAPPPGRPRSGAASTPPPIAQARPAAASPVPQATSAAGHAAGAASEPAGSARSGGPAQPSGSRATIALAIAIAVAGIAVALGLVVSRGAGPVARGDAPAAPASAPAAASTGASPSGTPRSSTPAAAPAPAPAAPPPIARGSELGLDAEVSGTLEPDGVRRHPFTVPGGRYYVELFARAPDPPDSRCGQPKVTVTVIDRDEARVGDVVTSATWDRDNWEKRRASYDLSGAYQVSLRAGDCRVLYRVRVVSSAP